MGEASTNKRLKINSDENDITDPKLDDHADQCTPPCEVVTLEKCKNYPEFPKDKQLTTAEGHTSFPERRLSNCINNDSDDLKKVLCGEEGVKSTHSSSSKTVVIHATGVKNSACLSSISNAAGNDESCLDIQRQEEVACHLFSQASLEIIRERFASYITYSGSDSGTSDSEALDLNDQKKDGLQTGQIMQNTEKEIASQCHNSSNGLKENEKEGDENSEAEKEKPFSGNNRKFSMKWNITAKKVESVNSLTPGQGIWEQDALMSHTEDTRLSNAFELRLSVGRNSSNSTDAKTQADKTQEKISDHEDDIFHFPIQTKAFSNNEESNRCTSENRMTTRLHHDSPRNDISAEKSQEKSFKVKDDCSREKCQQNPEVSRGMSSIVQKGNRTVIGRKESEVKAEDCTRSERPTHTNSLNTNKSIKNANVNTPCLDSSSSSSDRDTRNLAIKKKCLGSGTTSDESVALKKRKNINVNELKKGSCAETEYDHLATKQTLRESKTGKVNNAEKGTRNDARKVSIRRQTRPNISLEKEHGLQKQSARETTPSDKQSAKQANVHKEEDVQKSSFQSRIPERSVSPEKDRWQRKSRNSMSRERESRHEKRSRVDSSGDEEWKSRSTRRSASPERSRWQRKSREKTSIDKDDDDWKSSSRSRDLKRSASPERDRWRRKSPERTSLDRDRNRSHVDKEDDNDSKNTHYRSRSPRRSSSPSRERWRRKSPERTSLDRESKRSYVDVDGDDDYDYKSKSSYYRSSSPRRSSSPSRDRWRRKSPERTSLDRESKRSHVDENDEYESKRSTYYPSGRSASPERGRWRRNSPEITSVDRGSKRSSSYYRNRSSRRSFSPAWQRNSRERTSREKDVKYSKQSHEDDDDSDWKSYSWPRRNARRSASRERERWQRERRSVDRESMWSHIDNDDDDDWKSSSRRRTRRSASRGKEHWQGKSRERTSVDRESRRSHIDNDDDDDWKSSSRYRNSRRSASLERERWQRKSRERTSVDRESRRSHIDNDDDDDWKSSSRYRNSRRSASLERERWQRKSRERTSVDRESRRSHIDNDDNDDWKSSSRRCNSRRSASLENERAQRTSRESRSPERDSEHAVGNPRSRNERFRSPAPRPSRMRQNQHNRRRFVSESPDMSWIQNIVVKIADPPRGPLRKRRNQGNRPFIRRSKVERSRNTTEEERRLEEPSTSENKSENNSTQKKRRWTYDDYTEQTDGSLKRKSEFRDDEEEHYAWKRYDDERTMPYQGYADSQVQSLLRQLSGDYVTRLYSKENSAEVKSSCQDTHGSDENVKNHRSWFMTINEWICHGVQSSRAEDLTKQTVASKDPSTAITTTTVPVVWHTVPLLINTKDQNGCQDNTKPEKLEGKEKQSQAKTDKVYGEKEVEQSSVQKESLTKEESAIQTSSFDNTPSLNGRKHSNTAEEAAIDSSVGRESFTFDSLGAIDSWDTCNDDSLARQMARNDLLVMVTPSSYWYEKQLLQEQKEKLPKEKSTKANHHPSLYIPTSFSSSPLTNVTSFSMCFHCDTSMFEFSPQILNSSDVDEKNQKAGKDPILEHDTTPQTGRNVMESDCNTGTGAKRHLNFDSIIERPSQETEDKTVDSVCGSDSTNEKKITSTGTSIQNNVPKMNGSSSSVTISNLPNLKMPSDSTSNECSTIENVNSKEENHNSDGKKLHQEKNNNQQFVEEVSGAVVVETAKDPSPRTNIPLKKIEKENDHKLVEGDTVDVLSQKKENNFPRTSLPRTNIGKDIDSPSILKNVAEDPKCKAGEEMWELALKSTTSSKTSHVLENQTLDKGTAFTKPHPKPGDLDVAVVKPSPRQIHGTALNETSETHPDSNVNIINIANTIPVVSDGAPKMPVQKKPPFSHIKVTKNLEYSKNPANPSRCFPSPAPGPVASTARDPLQNIPKRPQEGRGNLVDVASEEVVVAGVRKNLTENVPHEILPGNYQRAWGADLRHGAQGPHIRLLQTQDQYGHSFQTPNPQPQQQKEENHMTQPSFYNNIVVQNTRTNTSLNGKVMPSLSNRIHDTLPQQQEGNSNSLLQNQTVLINDVPLVVNQQQAMMPKRDIRSGNDSFQGLFLEAQNNLRPSGAPPLNDSLVTQGIDGVHGIHPWRYPTVTAAPVYFQPPEHQQQQLPFQQQQIHFQHQHQQQQLQLQQQQQQQQLKQQQQLRLQHQQHLRQQQYQKQQQQQQQQQQNLQQRQQMQQQNPQQQQQRNSQQQLQLQQQRIIPDGPAPIHQQQAVVTQPPRHYPVLEESSQLEKWHDDFLNASITQDNLSHIPWGQHALDFGHRGDLRMFPQYRPMPASLQPNAPALFFNAQNTLSE